MYSIVIASVCSIILAVRAHECGPQGALTSPFIFGFVSDSYPANILNVIVKFKNQCPNMDYTVHETGENKKYNFTNKIERKTATAERFKILSHTIKRETIFISIYLTIKTNDGCSKNITILEGRGRGRNRHNTEKAKPGYEMNDKCLKPCTCTIEVDVSHECREAAHHQTTPDSNVLAYVIPAVIAICVIILIIIYLIVKHCCQYSQPPEETLELNTYDVASDIVYADLNLANGDSHPPKHDEESNYTEIIGVLAPADNNHHLSRQTSTAGHRPLPSIPSSTDSMRPASGRGSKFMARPAPAMHLLPLRSELYAPGSPRRGGTPRMRAHHLDTSLQTNP